MRLRSKNLFQAWAGAPQTPPVEMYLVSNE
jgi:hypothetical protein